MSDQEFVLAWEATQAEANLPLWQQVTKTGIDLMSYNSLDCL